MEFESIHSMISLKFIFNSTTSFPNWKLYYSNHTTAQIGEPSHVSIFSRKQQNQKRSAPHCSKLQRLFTAILFDRKIGVDCTCGTRMLASATSNTFCAVNILQYFHLHWTNLFTSFAINTLISIYTHLKQCKSIEQSVNATQGTQIFAEGAIHKHRG